MIIVGLDIGATKIRYAVFDTKKRRLLLDNELKYRHKTKGEFLRILKEISRDKELKKLNFRKIGIGIAGVYENGKLIYFSNFPKLQGIDLIKEVKKIFKKPVIVENDANCFVYAEVILGAGKKYNNIVGLTLGSGLGSGIVINKEIYHGKGAAGEIGHTIIQLKTKNSRLRRGFGGQAKLKATEVEDLCSEKFFHKSGIKDIIDSEIKARKGDKKAKKIYRDFGKNLGIVIANIINTLDPDVIVLGGGLSHAYNLFIREVKKTAKKFIVNPKSKNIPILKSRLGKSAGAIGATLL